MSRPNTNPRLVITSVSPSGLSTFTSDKEIPLFQPFGPVASSFSVFDLRASVPINNTESAAGHTNKIPRCPPNGVVFCISNIPPGFTVPMHRTISLDYGIVLDGEIVLRLDSGEERTVKAGEFIVQGGATHSWVNVTEQECRIGFVSVAAEKIRLEDGRELEEMAPVHGK